MPPAQNPHRPPIGGSSERIDALGKVTGQALYAGDMHLPGLLHACVLRSPHHYARLLSLDTRPALALPGVLGVLTAADIPGENSLGWYSRDEPLLAPVGETLRQKGAPLALAAAETEVLARRAAEAIRVEYELLPHTFETSAALGDEAPALYPGGNVLSRYTLSYGDLQAAFAGSEIVLESEYQTSFQAHCALEPEAVLAYLEADGRLVVVGGTHEPHWQQEFIASALGLPLGRVRVIMPPTGGSFGGKQDPWPLVAGGLLAYRLRRPVRLVYSRREVFDAAPKRHPYQMALKLGATHQGRLRGLQLHVTANTGGYDSAGTWIPGYAVTAGGGAYAWQGVEAFSQAVYTNAPKAGQFRGFGSPQSVFALEAALDELAQTLALDPFELRLDNLLQQGQETFLGYPVGESLGYRESLEAVRPYYRAYQEEAQLYNERNSASRMDVGLAGMWYRFGKSGTLRIETYLELARDGHFIVYCSAPDYGQGIGTVLLQLAAETLGVPREQIELVNADTDLTPDSTISGASRATYFIGQSVCRAAENLKNELFAAASELLDSDPAELVLGASGVGLRRQPERRVSLPALASELEALGKSRKVPGVFDLTPQFPDATRPEYIPLFLTGAQAAQVLVDLETGQAVVKRLAAAHDVGRVINPPQAAGQVRGAVLMGIGAALYEEYLPGKTTGFADYILPMSLEQPEIEVLLVEVPSYHGPLGAKGVGEAAILPTAPAVINALSRAAGVRIRRLPATPPRVLAALRPHP